MMSWSMCGMHSMVEVYSRVSRLHVKYIFHIFLVWIYIQNRFPPAVFTLIVRVGWISGNDVPAPVCPRGVCALSNDLPCVLNGELWRIAERSQCSLTAPLFTELRSVLTLPDLWGLPLPKHTVAQSARTHVCILKRVRETERALPWLCPDPLVWGGCFGTRGVINKRSSNDSCRHCVKPANSTPGGKASLVIGSRKSVLEAERNVLLLSRLFCRANSNRRQNGLEYPREIQLETESRVYSLRERINGPENVKQSCPTGNTFHSIQQPKSWTSLPKMSCVKRLMENCMQARCFLIPHKQ